MPFRLSLCFTCLLFATALAQDAPTKRFRTTTATEAEQWQKDSRTLLFDLPTLTDLATANEMIPYESITVSEFNHPNYTQFGLQINSTNTRRIKVIVTSPSGKRGEQFPAVVCIHGHGGNRDIVYQPGLYNAFAKVLAEKGFVTISTD